jgi:hypothetical protein
MQIEVVSGNGDSSSVSEAMARQIDLMLLIDCYSFNRDESSLSQDSSGRVAPTGKV